MFRRPQAAFAVVLLLACALLLVPWSGWSQGLGKVKAKAAPKEDKIPPDLAPEKVDGYLAGISDEQARRLLASELKAKAAARGAGSKEQVGIREKGFVFGFYEGQRTLSALSGQLSGIISEARTSADSDTWEKLAGGKGPGRLFTALVSFLLIVLVGLAVERLLLRTTQKIRRQLLGKIPHAGWEKAGIFLSGMILDALGFAVYMLSTFIAYFLLQGRGQPAYLVSSAIICTYYFRMVVLAARWVVSPGSAELRPIDMSDSDARLLYKWIVVLAASVLPVAIMALALQQSGADRDLFLLVYSTAGPVMSIVLSVMIWRIRRRVAALILPAAGAETMATGSFRQSFAALWHYPAILLALAVGMAWWVRVLTHADATIFKLVLSLFLVPLCIGADQWLKQILSRIGGPPREIIDLSGSDEDWKEEPAGRTEEPRQIPDAHRPKGMDVFFPLIRKTFRLVLLIFLFFAVLDFWGIRIDIGRIFARNVLGILIAFVLGLLAWEIVKTLIDRKIEEGMPLQSDDAEEGGSGGSRTGTLLMLLRKFIMVFLFLVIGFSILASLGVNIAPLLAGAGVVGLAIGFGSQTLVKDIISGVFFLVDDAFRVGDYVEAGTAKGTVEQISIRSLRLRHPRGQVFIVPFGDLKMVQNFTRDYIIEKLDIRVRFDTDPDVIRKIVKKINQRIMAEEEFAKGLLSDIKSAGIRAMDDSAMIIRVKFKCIPGEQYVLRREVFQRIQKAFREKGIEFAHRNVTVYLPPQPPTEGEPAPASGGRNLPLEAAGAAAAAALAQAEAEALAKATDKKKSG
ncbi:MAG: mechanosensitive ion channel family protein [Syntrophobacteraceae bacterium]|nr:mechanosensitive ion channel family protein [Desulfobacteraceae bacterium]